MQFKPKTEKEIAEENLIPAGTYPFETMSAEPKRSKAGNDMIELKQRIFLPDGSEKTLTDWLLESPAYKLFHYCAYTGLATHYERGTLQSTDCVGRQGYAKIGIQQDKTGQYPDRNSIRDYVRNEIKQGGTGVAGGSKQPTDAQLANLKEGPSEDVPY